GRLDPVSRSQYLDTLQYLPADILTKVDRMSMANSLEVRAPLLDYTLVEYVATLPVSLTLRGTLCKYLLRKDGERRVPAVTRREAPPRGGPRAHEPLPRPQRALAHGRQDGGLRRGLRAPPGPRPAPEPDRVRGVQAALPPRRQRPDDPAPRLRDERLLLPAST